MAKVAILPLISLTLNPAEAQDIRDALMESSNKNAGKWPRIDESIGLLDQALSMSSTTYMPQCGSSGMSHACHG